MTHKTECASTYEHFTNYESELDRTMYIQKSGNKIVCRRYGGTAGGKNLSSRIGTLPAETSPSGIPQELIDDLTPKELKQLQEHLRAQEAQRALEKGKILAGELNDVASAIESGMLSEDTIIGLVKACKALLKSARRFEKPKLDASATEIAE